MSGTSCELSRNERTAIRKLVVSMCANYDSKYGCLPLDGECYMLGKWWTGAYCKYFEKAVLPLDPRLEAALMGHDNSASQRVCPVCGAAYFAVTCKAYCSPACQKEGNRRRSRERMRKKRRNHVV